MRPGWKTLGLPGAAAAVPVVLLPVLFLAATLRPAAGDEPGRLGRLFRFVGGPSSSSTTPAPTTDPTPGPSATPTIPGPSAEPPPAGPSPRIVPRPRVSRAVTESDPLVTRITLNRSDDGGQFGMFLQVFADGTIIDGEGAHRVGRDELRPLVEALQSGELYRLKGHCGGPSTDFIESVQVTVFERSLGRLRASSFSYSGNPQGCDNAVRHLHATLDNLQSRIARPGSAPAPALPPGAPVSPTIGNGNAIGPGIGNGNGNGGGVSGLAPLPEPSTPLAEPSARGGQAVIPLSTEN